MGIKWENIHVCVSRLTNEIYIIKGKEKTENGRTYLLASDKSEDRTDEVLDVIVQYFLNFIERGDPAKKTAVMEREGLYRLTFEDLREEASA